MLERIDAAKLVLDEIQKQRGESSNKKRQTTAPSASTSDPEARIMKLAGGGFAPAFWTVRDRGRSVGGASDGRGRTGDQSGHQQGSIWVMREQITGFTEATPVQLVVDAGT